MRVVVLGLSLSSSWGNGHATTYRALLRAFAARGHQVMFLEREQSWYADHRDLQTPDFCELTFYTSMSSLMRHREAIRDADAVIVGSYVPDGIVVGDLVRQTARGTTAFYDIDTPVTLAALERGDCAYLAADQISGYDLYLSFTGGPTLDLLMDHYGSPDARALYCCVDETSYRPTQASQVYDLGYLGTYSADRQPTLERLLIEPARRAPERRFIVAGPQYPPEIDWPANVERRDHVPPADHPAFYNSCRFTLNVTRADMRRAGYSPSVRLFEAGACAAPIISDPWAGLDELFELGPEIALAEAPEDMLRLLAMDEPARQRMGQAGQARVLASHTAATRASELEAYFNDVAERRGDAARDDERATATRHVKEASYERSGHEAQ
ncbi:MULTISPECIES: glycosyltransferase [unclassified Chelatococcus]|uniref:CgeB family protein n=1 Tax=unclassified Chelatococcus TaxID=2638111 RepID=UPI001BCAC7EE|nr:MULTISPECIES: glycosyltransferase [unclassified Chelatococcus]MBS7700040.1 glycosyltransferase [Chelatococcus sp. YT9]MBX3556733.1 glycosyltransferase [Chelatococcus sp.]